MTNGKMVHLRISSDVYAELKKAEKSLCFDSVQSMIKDLLRNFVLEMRRKEALEWLEKNKGRMKGNIKSPSVDERALLAKQFLEKNKGYGRKTGNVISDADLEKAKLAVEKIFFD